MKSTQRGIIIKVQNSYAEKRNEIASSEITDAVVSLSVSRTEAITKDI